MKELLDTLATWQADGTAGADVGRAVVVRTFGSAPRPEGAVLLYATDGRIAGSVSGGCVEGAAAEEIEHARATGHARVIRYGISDEQAWDVGLACGGTIDVLVEPVAPAVVIDGGPRLGGCRRSRVGGRHATPRRLAAGRVRPAPAGRGRAARPPSWSSHDDGRLDRHAGRRRSSTPRSSRPPGRRSSAACRGRSSSAVARCSSRSSRSGRGSSSSAASRSPARSSGSRASSASRPSSSTAGRRSRRRSASPTSTGSSSAGRTRSPTRSASGPNDAVAVLTHDVKFDEPAIVEALRRGCRYVGAVGSRKTQADRRARLLEAGVSEAELARLRGPVGLDLGGRAPAETALAILAEIVAERYGGSGAPMRERALAIA